MKVKSTRGFHSVAHPETGEEIVVEDPFETDKKTFNLLTSNYPGFEVVEEVEDDDNSEGETTEEDDAEYKCGVNGCSRDVDSPESTCWQHPNDE